ncbi:cell division protein FtsA [Gracilibacillus boraciitolerans JCM 21714]|uniref:Cell division protein FtsA n=1 Tax=Gracilibacillus boraciitolerans JCM 21714 TaxID=1298598 RepID=W4VJG6_9BACI|nr:cell division protein FtsA [Gracilibacillus boraciitolerans JCM 21714]
MVNSTNVSSNYILKDGGDKIIYQQHITVQQFLKEHNIDMQLHQPFTIWIDDQRKELDEYSSTLLHNGQIASMDALLKNGGDKLMNFSGNQPTLQDLLETIGITYQKEMSITYNGKPIKLTKELVKVYRRGEILNLEDKIEDHDMLQFIEQKTISFIFQDIFRFISLDLTRAKGKIDLKRNGQPVTFFEELKPNDKIEINIENRQS